MHAKPHIILSPHRRARLIAWALALLAWVHAVFYGAHIMSRRRLRQRGCFLSLDGVAYIVARLIVIRAAELIGPRRPRTRHIRDRGVNLKRRHFMRSVIGSRLRRALKHRDVTQRIALLIAALNALDTWAARFADRLRRRVTKLWAIGVTPCVAEPLAAGAASVHAAADTS